KALEVRSRKRGDEVEYFSKFDLSEGSSVDFSFFERAEVARLEVYKKLPLYIDEQSMESLTKLFSGCAIQVVSLVFDQSTLQNLNLVPSFLKSVHCRNVEFVLEKTFKHNMVDPFRIQLLADDLARNGV
ncbi:hypothetical protein PFISCL1PPCAC_1366, partial [Pristionchus fissidentatus]